jgi:Cu-Zn family superoxide dismutase
VEEKAMRSQALISALALALAGAMPLASEQEPQGAGRPGGGPGSGQPATMGEVTARAAATIKGEGITGRATLTERKMGDAVVVSLQLSAEGLKPGQHGVHLHAVGKCEPDFAAAGGHFDPGPASNTDPDANHPYHMGDMPNLTVGPDGKGELRAMTTRVTLSEGPLSLFDGDGSAIIIHGNPDKMITGEPKSGVSGGPRAACGVIEQSP